MHWSEVLGLFVLFETRISMNRSNDKETSRRVVAYYPSLTTCKITCTETDWVRFLLVFKSKMQLFPIDTLSFSTAYIISDVMFPIYFHLDGQIGKYKMLYIYLY